MHGAARRARVRRRRVRDHGPDGGRLRARPDARCCSTAARSTTADVSLPADVRDRDRQQRRAALARDQRLQRAARGVRAGGGRGAHDRACGARAARRRRARCSNGRARRWTTRRSGAPRTSSRRTARPARFAAALAARRPGRRRPRHARVARQPARPLRGVVSASSICWLRCRWSRQGCHGARLTGAGFGGCAIALVDADRVDGVRERLWPAPTRSGTAPRAAGDRQPRRAPGTRLARQSELGRTWQRQHADLTGPSSGRSSRRRGGWR